MSVRLRFAASAVAWLLLLFFFQLASAQTDPAACSVSCRFVIVPTLGPQGLPGLNGTRGDTGDTGQRGPEGLRGPEGPPGIDGIDGKDGINGIDGKDGTNGIDGKDGADGATGSFDLSSTYTGLKLEAPVLTGAISIDGAVLTGSTNIGEGATITAPIIDGATMTGTTSISEGATILSPNITAPIIDGATIIGEGATLAKPAINGATITNAVLVGETTFQDAAQMTNPTISGATLQGTIDAPTATINGATLSGATLQSTNATGRFYVTDSPMLTLMPRITECRGSNTVSTTTLDAPCSFSYQNIGDVIEWEDGTQKTIRDLVNVNATGRSFSALVWSAGFTQVNKTLKIHSAAAKDSRDVGTQLTHDMTSIGGRFVMRGGGSAGGNGISAVTIDVFLMPGGPKHAVWTFPDSGVAGQLHYFVGDKTVQTLSSKTLQAAKVTNGLISGATTWDFPSTADATGKLVGENTAQILSNKTLTNTAGITFPAPASPSTSLQLNVYAMTTVTVKSAVWASTATFDLTFVRMGRFVTLSFPNCYAVIMASNPKMVFTTTSGVSEVIPDLYRPLGYETIPHLTFTDAAAPPTNMMGFISIAPAGGIYVIRDFTGAIAWEAKATVFGGFMSRSVSWLTPSA